jgi:hypothetical protein
VCVKPYPPFVPLFSIKELKERDDGCSYCEKVEEARYRRLRGCCSVFRRRGGCEFYPPRAVLQPPSLHSTPDPRLCCALSDGIMTTDEMPCDVRSIQGSGQADVNSPARIVY